MSIVAVRTIMPGEEILVNYNYDVKMAPEWYQTLWKNFMQNVESWHNQVRNWNGGQARDNSIVQKNSLHQ